MDADGSGRIDRDEFLNFFRNALGGASSDELEAAGLGRAKPDHALLAPPPAPPRSLLTRSVGLAFCADESALDGGLEAPGEFFAGLLPDYHTKMMRTFATEQMRRAVDPFLELLLDGYEAAATRAARVDAEAARAAAAALSLIHI